MARQTSWVDTSVSISVANNGQGTIRLGTLFPEFVLSRGITIIRTVVDFGVFSETVAGAWGVSTIVWGIGVESLEAFDGGSHPSPRVMIEQPTRGWLIRAQLAVSQNGVGTVIAAREEVDLHSQRKLDNGIVFFSVTNDNVVGTAFTARIQGLVRMLVMWP